MKKVAKEYHSIPIVECGEGLVYITNFIKKEHPHPYQKLGAPYNGVNPFMLRKEAFAMLMAAQVKLQKIKPSWSIKVYDALRPNSVQQFMVDQAFKEVAKKWEDKTMYLPIVTASLWEEVYKLWAIPSDDPATPPPHSTGGAIDVTIVDENGNGINMGSLIDEPGEISYPDYFSHRNSSDATLYDVHRNLLKRVMVEAGFASHPKEWWHYSYGDQMWALYMNKKHNVGTHIAKYGRVI